MRFLKKQYFRSASVDQQIDESIHREILDRKDGEVASLIRAIQDYFVVSNEIEKRQIYKSVWQRLEKHTEERAYSISPHTSRSRRKPISIESNRNISRQNYRSGISTVVAAFVMVLLVGSMVMMMSYMSSAGNSIASNSQTSMLAEPGKIPKGESSIRVSSSVSPKNVYGITENFVYSIDIEKREERWKYTFNELPQEVLATDYEAAERIKVVNGIAYILWKDKAIYALNAEVGNLLWKYELDHRDNSSSLMFEVLERGVYISSTNKDRNYHNIVLLNYITGQKIWERYYHWPASEIENFNSGLKLEDASKSILYFSNLRFESNGAIFTIYAVSASDGKIVWINRINRFITSEKGILQKGILYINGVDVDRGNEETFLIAFDAEIGYELWNKNYKGNVVLKEVKDVVLLLKSKNVNSAINDEGRNARNVVSIEGLDRKNGIVLWSHRVPGVNKSVDMLVANREVYISFSEKVGYGRMGTIIALGIESGKEQWKSVLQSEDVCENASYLISSTQLVCIDANVVEITDVSQSKGIKRHIFRHELNDPTVYLSIERIG